MIVVNQRCHFYPANEQRRNAYLLLAVAATVYFIVRLAQPSFYPFTRTTRVRFNRVQCIAKAEPCHLHCCRAFAFSSVFFVLCVRLLRAVQMVLKKRKSISTTTSGTLATHTDALRLILLCFHSIISYCILREQCAEDETLTHTHASYLDSCVFVCS